MPDVEIVLHPIPSADSKPYIIVFGPDRQLWFCESGTSKIGRMNPADGSFVEFATPTPDARPIGITPAADGARCGHGGDTAPVGRRDADHRHEANRHTLAGRADGWRRAAGAGGLQPDDQDDVAQ